jgi:hypothetical protein
MSVFNTFFSGRSTDYQLMETEAGELDRQMLLENLLDDLGLGQSMMKPVLRAGFVLGAAMCLAGAGALAIGAVPAAQMFVTIQSMTAGMAIAGGAAQMLQGVKAEESKMGDDLNNVYTREQVKFWLTKGSNNKRDNVSQAFSDRFGNSGGNVDWDFGADRPQVVTDWLEHHGLSHESQVNRQTWGHYSAQVDSRMNNAAPQVSTNRMGLG